MKNIYLLILLLVISGCDTPGTYQCSNGQTIDDCGNCRDCQSEECGWNDAMDDCGECYGDNTSCIECTDPLASNYTSNEECEYNNPELWIIDLQFLTEDSYCVSDNPEYSDQCALFDSNEPSCNIVANDSESIPDGVDEGEYECSWIGTFLFYTNIPLYWNNTSDQSITIYTEDTDGDYCDNTPLDTEADCNQYNNEIACEYSLCEWVLSPTYNPFWDTYTETIPNETIGIQHPYFFIGCESSDGECGAFNYQTEEIFCAQIDNQEKCGIIKVIN